MPEGPEHQFRTVLRGYDPRQVKIYLEQVDRLLDRHRAREEQLAGQLRRAGEELEKARQLDEETLMAALGEQTARVLHTAQEAAREIRARATEQAAQLVDEARAESHRALAEAESVMADRTEAAELVAGQMRRAAAAEGEKLLEAARSEAEALLAQARDQGREALREAQEMRASVLGELTRRRQLLHVQVEVLRAGKESLLDSIRVARSSLERIDDSLSRAESDARAAAEVATSRFGSPAGNHPTGQSAPEEHDRHVAAPAETESGIGQRADVLRVGELRGAVGPEPVGPDGAAATEVAAEAATEVTAEAAGQRVDPPAVQVAGIGSGGTGEGDLNDESEGRAPASRRADVARSGRAETDQGAGRETDGSQTARATEQDAAAEAPAGGGGTVGEAAPEPQPVPGEDRPGAKSSAALDPERTQEIDALFERIRATRAEEVQRARTTLADLMPTGGGMADGAEVEEDAAPEPPPAAANGTASDGGTGDGAGSEGSAPAATDDDSLALESRDAAALPAVAALARRLKRCLQDEQNAVLDRLRHGETGSEALLGSASEQRNRYLKCVASPLSNAWKAGWAYGSALIAHEPADGAEQVPAGRAAVDLAAGALASSLAEVVRQRLESVLESESDEAGPPRRSASGVPERDLASALGAAYREWRGRRLEMQVWDYALAVFSEAALAAMPEGSRVRWVVNDEDGRCPDCDDNALAGEIDNGAEFPTGQRHPPAHAGCRCLLRASVT